MLNITTLLILKLQTGNNSVHTDLLAAVVYYLPC